MPKQKSKKSVQKRVKVRKSGKVQRSQAFTSHLFANKSTKAKRKHRKQINMNDSDIKRYRDVM